MAKNKGFDTKKLDGIVVILVIATIVMMFLTNLVYDFTVDFGILGTAGEKESFSGIQAILGWASEDGKYVYANFSVWALLGYTLPLAGLLFIVLFRGNQQLGALLGAVCFVGSAVLLLVLPSLVVYSDITINAYRNFEGVALGIGAIIGAGLSIVNTLIMIFKAIINNK